MGCCGSKESNEEKSPIRNDFKPQYGQTTQVQEPAVNNHPTIHISSHYDDEDDDPQIQKTPEEIERDEREKRLKNRSQRKKSIKKDKLNLPPQSKSLPAGNKDKNIEETYDVIYPMSEGEGDDDLLSTGYDIGRIQIALQINRLEKSMIVTIQQIELPPTHHESRDLYVKLTLTPSNQVKKTSTQSGITTFLIDETFTFRINEKIIQNQVLQFTIRTRPRKNYIGEIRVKLRDLHDDDSLLKWHDLKKFRNAKHSDKLSLFSFGSRSEESDSGGSLGKREDHEVFGLCHLLTTYNQVTEVLTASIIQIRELNMSIKPSYKGLYIKIFVLPEGIVRKTKIFTRDENMMIEEQFEFSIPQYKLLTNTIQFSFKIGKRAHLGQVTFDLKGLSSDPKCEGWYSITSPSLCQKAKNIMKKATSYSSFKSFEDINEDGALSSTLKDSKYGELLVSFFYKNEKLDLEIKEGRGLKACDMSNLSDPYVVVSFHGEKDSRKRTKIQRNTLNPVFGQTFSYQLTLEELERKRLKFTIWNQEVLGKTFLGQAFFDLCGITENEHFETWLELGKQVTGEVKVKMAYEKDNCQITINIVSVKDLLPLSRRSNNIETYAKVYLLPDKQKTTKQKTAKQKGFRPEYPETIIYKLTDIQVSDKIIEISIIDATTSIGSLIGTVRYPLKDLLENQRVNEWLTLTRDLN